ncbi:MAG: helicase [Betaproteobacteria bacterium SG8_40]|jgi:ATP-dependent DNA helicase DinG|nr:MAG: helicase [Betaproteobacteria bacterium SG8_40]
MRPDLLEVFGDGGLLSRAIPGYRLRTQQLEMAQAVAAAIEETSVLIAEAGTGTGKTFAYLVAALLSGGKVIISTGTKTLQDQLYDRDIPLVRSVLAAPVTVSLLKGRANYVCHYHLERAKSDGRFLSRDDPVHLARIDSFARTSLSGDRSALADVPEDAPIWPMVTSTRDNCLGGECPHHSKCFVLEARKQALEADVVVVNHHLFFADVVLRDEGVGELLPACNTVIFDEAHQLPETASLFFGDHVSTNQLVELGRDIRLEVAADAGDAAALQEQAQAVEKAARDLRLQFARDSERRTHEQVFADADFVAALDHASGELQELIEHLDAHAARSEGLHQCWERATMLADALQRWRNQADADHVRWVEVFASSLRLNSTPLSVADVFRNQLSGHPKAWIFTSATLSVRQDFSHYQQQMGLEDAVTRSWDSPFDYQNQSVLFVPEEMPDPNSAAYTEAVVSTSLPLIEAAGGHAFLLFTSLRAMREAKHLLVAGMQERALDFPLLMQGDASRSELLERFRELGNAVLLGSQSFWEGVDVRGEALSLVIIDRLPFAPPDDPVLAARIAKINREGRNAFMEYQLPEAVISLRQGAGRLIRDERDRGVLVICDPRLISKPYGRRIWQSLPPMRRSRNADEVCDFLRNPERESDTAGA